ncbi:MAG: glycosyltransferase [Chloroflexota bacterium]|nr:glycosyltransferase [Chloroflexota bacterium]
MTVLTRTKSLTEAKTSAIQKPMKVCMHDMRSARNDVRAMRAATTLVEAGFSVSIVDVAITSTTSVEEGLPGIEMHHITVPRSFLSTRFERWAILKAVLLFIRSTFRVLSERADIYHACEVTALPACYLAARFRHKPLIFEAYELPLCDRPLFDMSRSRRWLHSLLTIVLAHILPRCTAVITVSPPIVQEIKKCYRVSRVSLLRNLPTYKKVSRTNYLRERLGLAPDVRIALYQGYLQPDRGLERLVRAASYLEPNMVIVLMGQGVGTTQDDLERLIVEKGVADRVKILPSVPYHELLAWTASADIGLTVIPLDYTLNMKMCLPNKLFEYLMAGLPVLSAPLEAVTEIITTYGVGHIVPSMEPAAVGAAINAMVKDETVLANMRSNALTAAEQTLCWEREGPELVRLYHEVLNTFLRNDSKCC